ncbi:MltR family transcriptional regulator [Niallia alba]|uniref:MltR family transcriptional regulator n=1 Tax=Niallia alba TaxID=2729105 RepID=UPI002E236C31|nr:MltR family transcriptional regulator [Niallia alba]
MDSLLESVMKNNNYIDYIKEFEKEVESDNERGIVLVCGSIIDYLLQELLQSFMINEDSITKDLFRGNSSLSTFDAKIKTSYYLGLINKELVTNITLIQKVRNKFAHQIVDISFNNEAIKSICLNFKIPKNAYQPKIIPVMKNGDTELPKLELNPIKKDTPSKDRFIFTFRYIFTILLGRIFEASQERRIKYEKILTADQQVLLMINTIEESFKKREDDLIKLEDSYNELRERAEKSGEKVEKTPEDMLVTIESIDDNLERAYKELEEDEERFAPLLKMHKYTYEVLRNSLK